MLRTNDMRKSAWGKKCPVCSSHVRTRIHRKFWMRLIPWSKYYVCADCKCRYLSMMGIFSFKRRCIDDRDESLQMSSQQQ